MDLGPMAVCLGKKMMMMTMMMLVMKKLDTSQKSS
jgi:hypothetical protein